MKKSLVAVFIGVILWFALSNATGVGKVTIYNVSDFIAPFYVEPGDMILYLLFGTLICTTGIFVFHIHTLQQSRKSLNSKSDKVRGVVRDLFRVDPEREEAPKEARADQLRKMKKVNALVVAVVFLLVPAAGQASDAPGSLQSQHLELLKKAKELYDQGDNGGAITVCDEYVKKLGPDFHPQVWFLRGNAYHKIFQNTKKEVHIGQAIESYEKALALYKDVKTYTGLDSVGYQIDGMFNLGLLCEEQYELLFTSWDPQIRKEKEWRIISSISEAMSLAEMYGEWKEPIDEQRERYLDRSLQTYLDMIVRSDMPDVYLPLAESICARGRASKEKEKYAKYAETLAFDPNIKTCVYWIRGKELAETVLAYDDSIDQLRKGLGLAESEKAQATICRQVADIYLKKDSFEDKKFALDYASRAWEQWKKNRQAWGDRQDIFDTYGSSLKAVAVGIAMSSEPSYDRIIQICHQALRIPNYGDRYYMNYLLSYASYQKGDEDLFYRHGKQAVQVVLDKYSNEFDKAQSEEEKEVLMFWVNSLRGSGRVLEAMRYQEMGD